MKRPAQEKTVIALTIVIFIAWLLLQSCATVEQIRTGRKPAASTPNRITLGAQEPIRVGNISKETDYGLDIDRVQCYDGRPLICTNRSPSETECVCQ